MKLGFAAFGHLVDVKPIASSGRSSGRTAAAACASAGTVTHRTIERSPLVARGLARARRDGARASPTSACGPPGRSGGNLAFADPHSDPATFLLAAGATVHLARAGARRSLAVADFVLGPYETALEPGEVLEAVEVPLRGQREAMAHLRFAVHERPAATVSAWVRVDEGRVGGGPSRGGLGRHRAGRPGRRRGATGRSAGHGDRRDVLREIGIGARGRVRARHGRQRRGRLQARPRRRARRAGRPRGGGEGGIDAGRDATGGRPHDRETVRRLTCARPCAGHADARARDDRLHPRPSRAAARGARLRPASPGRAAGSGPGGRTWAGRDGDRVPGDADGCCARTHGRDRRPLRRGRVGARPRAASCRSTRAGTDRSPAASSARSRPSRTHRDGAGWTRRRHGLPGRRDPTRRGRCRSAAGKALSAEAGGLGRHRCGPLRPSRSTSTPSRRPRCGCGVSRCGSPARARSPRASSSRPSMPSRTRSAVLRSLPAARAILEHLELDGDVEEGGGLVARMVFLVWADDEAGLEALGGAAPRRRARGDLVGPDRPSRASSPTPGSPRPSPTRSQRPGATSSPTPLPCRSPRTSARCPDASRAPSSGSAGRAAGRSTRRPGRQQFASEDGVAAAMTMAEVLALTAARLTAPG